MKKLDWRVAAFAFVLCVPASLASAQDATTTTEATAPPGMVSETPPPGMVSETPPPVEQPEDQKKGLEVSFTWSLGIGVPIILKKNVPEEARDAVRPGANIFFFGGADFGWFIIGGDAGLQWNPIDFNRVNIAGLAGRGPLTRIYLSAPDLRFQVPDLPVVLPYLGFSFDMNFWNLAETAVGCGYWYCTTYRVYRFTPGFTGKAGLGFKIKESGVHIDVGFQYSFTGKGNFFEDSGWWLAPYVGVLVRQR